MNRSSDAVKKYRMRRYIRLLSRMDCKDNSQKPLTTGGKYVILNMDANNALAFALCKEKGIDLPPDATPGDAWEALKGEGITSENAYSKLSSRADKTTKNKHASVIQKLNTPDYEDGTYDTETLEPIEYPDGFQVTFCQIGDDYSDDDYSDKVNEFLGVSSDKKTLAGKFEGTPEISFHVKDRETAEKLAKKYNQISIWDWENGDEISTGGTGRRE